MLLKVIAKSKWKRIALSSRIEKEQQLFHCRSSHNYVYVERVETLNTICARFLYMCLHLVYRWTLLLIMWCHHGYRETELIVKPGGTTTEWTRSRETADGDNQGRQVLKGRRTWVAECSDVERSMVKLCELRVIRQGHAHIRGHTQRRE